MRKRALGFAAFVVNIVFVCVWMGSLGAPHVRPLRRVEPPPLPVFCTFAFTHVGRWSARDMRTALRYMYSSLDHAHNDRGVLLHLYTNAAAAGFERFTTFRGGAANIRVHRVNVSDIVTHGYKDRWAGLSAFKLDIVASHRGPVIWIDLDTLVFTSLDGVGPDWVVGWHHGARDTTEISGHPIPPWADCQGDIWSLSPAGVGAVSAVEHATAEKPTYDLQGFFSIGLATGRLGPVRILQELLPRHALGMHCFGFKHPVAEKFNGRVVVGADNTSHIECAPFQHLGTRMGVLSFTAPTFRRVVIAGQLLDERAMGPAAAWFRAWFFGG